MNKLQIHQHKSIKPTKNFLQKKQGHLGEGTSATMTDKVQTFGRKKTAVAVALVKQGKGNFRVNGLPLDQLTPEILRVKGRMIFGSFVAILGR